MLAPEGAGDETPVDAAKLLECRRQFAGLMDVDKHYKRKEHLLFSCLERHGITGPSTVMWGKDDEVRALLKELGTALAENGGTAGEWRLVAQAVAEPAFAAIDEMIFKEEKILLPMALQNLTETEWGEIYAQSPEFGYCLVDPLEGYRPPEPVSDLPDAALAEAARAGVAFTLRGGCAPLVSLALPGSAPPPRPDTSAEATSRGAIVLPTGALGLEQLKALFATLPVDITFVDADDRVRFFSEGRHRVFERPKAILGRLVQHCHPPGASTSWSGSWPTSAPAGRTWRSSGSTSAGASCTSATSRCATRRGTYLGTLEVTQDLTRERALDGERRLLQYGAERVGRAAARPDHARHEGGGPARRLARAGGGAGRAGPRLQAPAQPGAAADRGPRRDAGAGCRRRGGAGARAGGRAAPRRRARGRGAAFGDGSGARSRRPRLARRRRGSIRRASSPRWTPTR